MLPLLHLYRNFPVSRFLGFKGLDFGVFNFRLSIWWSLLENTRQAKTNRNPENINKIVVPAVNCNGKFGVSLFCY